MTKRIVGYTAVVGVFLLALFLSQRYGFWLPVVGAALAVYAGALLGHIRLLGVAVTFALLSVVFPVTVLYVIGVEAGLESPVQELLLGDERIRFIYPLLSALVAYTTVALYRRLRHSESVSALD